MLCSSAFRSASRLLRTSSTATGGLHLKSRLCSRLASTCTTDSKPPTNLKPLDETFTAWQIFVLGNDQSQQEVYLGTTTTQLYFDPPTGAQIGVPRSNYATIFTLNDTGMYTPRQDKLWEIRNYVTHGVSAQVVQTGELDYDILMNGINNIQYFYFRDNRGQKSDPNVQSGSQGQLVSIWFNALDGTPVCWFPPNITSRQAPERMIVGKARQATMFKLIPISDELELPPPMPFIDVHVVGQGDQN